MRADLAAYRTLALAWHALRRAVLHLAGPGCDAPADRGVAGRHGPPHRVGARRGARPRRTSPSCSELTIRYPTREALWHLLITALHRSGAGPRRSTRTSDPRRTAPGAGHRAWRAARRTATRDPPRRRPVLRRRRPADAPAAATRHRPLHRPGRGTGDLGKPERDPTTSRRSSCSTGRRASARPPRRALGAPRRDRLPRRAAVPRPTRPRPRHAGHPGRGPRGDAPLARGRPAADPDALAERSALLRSALSGRRMLILLDNARDVDQIRPLLPGGPGLVLVTSRDQLRGLSVRHGAHRVTVPPLSSRSRFGCSPGHR